MKNRINADQEKTRNFHQYTVGEMAGLLSMSAPTIRFYDSQGAVVPHRDEDNQYRKYTVVDGNYLIKMKELKNVGASLQDSVRLLNDVDLEEYCAGFRQLEQAEQKRIERQQLLLQGFQRKITLIESLETELNQITLGMRPALWRMDHQIEDQFRAQKAAVTARANWTDWMPAADLSFLFSAGDPEHALHWGFAMEAPLAEALELVGMSGFARRSFSTLSGGEQQRVILARALAQQTPCLILDEPTNHLDIKYQLELMDIVKSLDRTVISAIHDLNIAAMYCDRLYAVKGGEIVGCGRPQEVLTEDFIRRVYEVEAKVFSDESGQLHILYHPAHRL